MYLNNSISAMKNVLKLLCSFMALSTSLSTAKLPKSYTRRKQTHTQTEISVINCLYVHFYTLKSIQNVKLLCVCVLERESIPHLHANDGINKEEDGNKQADIWQSLNTERQRLLTHSEDYTHTDYRSHVIHIHSTDYTHTSGRWHNCVTAGQYSGNSTSLKQHSKV